MSLLLGISCSEGDLIEDTIDFTAPLQNCQNENTRAFVFYKINPNANQTLALSFSSDPFNLNTIPENGETLSIPLNGSTNTLIYREFNTAIDGDTYFCANVPPNTASITRELTASEGSIEIKYTLASEHSNSKTYMRTFELRNVTLIGPDVTYRNELLVLGSDEITVTALAIDFESALQRCDTTDTDTFVFYNIDSNTNRALSLQFVSSDFAALTPDPDTPFTIALNGSSNRLMYQEFDAAIEGNTYFCANDIPTDGATLITELIASVGSVQIRYAPIASSSNSFTRTIELQNITLTGANATFQNEIIILGSDEVTIPNSP